MKEKWKPRWWCGHGVLYGCAKDVQPQARDITLERALEENEALRQILKMLWPMALYNLPKGSALLERMRAAVGEKA